METQTIIKYVKIGVYITIAVITFNFIRKQIKLRKIREQFGDINTITDNDKGNTGGVSLPQDQDNLVWSPRSSAEALRDAMDPYSLWWGTDENKIWRTLDALDKNQLNKVRLYFDSYFGDGESLFEWFEGDLSGQALAKAKSYFN